MEKKYNELDGIITKFAASGWDVLDAPSKEWLDMKGKKEWPNVPAMIAAVKAADKECGSCGCEFDPLYKQSLELLMYLSPCGINCEACPYQEGCGGSCHECKGKPFYIKDFGVEYCPMYECAVIKKGYKTCGECPELPCKIHYDWKDPSMTEEAHVQSIKERTEILKASV